MLLKRPLASGGGVWGDWGCTVVQGEGKGRLLAFGACSPGWAVRGGKPWGSAGIPEQLFASLSVGIALQMWLTDMTSYIQVD